MENGKTIRLAVIGCGDIAVTRHIPTIVNHPNAVLAALCDADSERLRSLEAQYGGVRMTTDFHEILSDPTVEAVIIATPPWVTPIITQEALQAGKHVLCEKPMATDLETAEEVIETQKITGKQLQIGLTYRHGPLMEKLRSWIEDGRLGSPLLYRLGIFEEPWNPVRDPEHYKRIFQTMAHGSPSLHDGAHVADFLYFLTQSTVTRVDSFGLRTRDEFPSSNYDVSIIRFANGDMAKIEIGWFFPKLPLGEFEVVGPKGYASFDRFNGAVQLVSESHKETVELEEEMAAVCFRSQLESFLASISAGKPCIPGVKEGWNSLYLTKQIDQSLRKSNDHE
ncbi:Gfo/Idh/MocA family protein [Paenibacillus senegalensis]|uniref:Gfo/Idh/MocA family protein n=1 Tax=Paenibacillus senegalensis TaxID=1465766 RepID=UPI000288D2C5|nr:Gfo/Idh/MocA family oxidoreductase [Paenibacillus senegalensis]